MIIESVELRNFRSHSHTVIDFGRGTNVLVGENGSGKTSVLEAIAYAIFRAKPQGVNLEQLVRSGSEEMNVAVDFTLMNRSYRVIRSRSRKKAGKTALYRLESGGQKLLALGDEQVNARIEELLGIGGDVFLNAMYARQGEIDSLLNSIPSERKKLMGRLIGTSEMEEVHRAMGDVVRHFSYRLEGYRDIGDKLKEKEKRISSYRKEHKALERERKSLKESLEEAKEKRKNLKEKLGTIRRAVEVLSEKEYLERLIAEKRRELGRIESYIRIESSEARSAREYEKLRREKDSLSREIARLDEVKRQNNDLQRNLKDLERKKKLNKEYIQNFLIKCSRIAEEDLKSIQDAEEMLKRMLEGWELRKEKLGNSINSIRSEINYCERKIGEFKKNIEDIGSLEGSCPTCKRPLDSHTREEIVEELKNEIHSYREKREKLSSRFKNKENKVERIKKEIEKTKELNFDLAKSKISDLGAMLEEIESLNQDINKNKDALEKNVEIKSKAREIDEKVLGLKESYNRYIEAKNYLRKYLPEKESLEEEIEKLKESIGKKEGEIASFKEKLGFLPDKEVLKNEEEELERVNAKVESLMSALSSAEAKMSAVSTRIGELKDEMEELRAKEEEREKLEVYIHFLERVRALFHRDVLQRKMRERARPLIEKYTREVFESFNLPYSDLIINDDYSISFVGPDGERGFETLSGGEVIASSLALRIGIARALSGPAMDIIALDEPTVHLDSPRRRELVEITKRLRSLAQTIIVTHDREFEEAASRVYQVEKSGGISRVRDGSGEYAPPYPPDQ